MVQIKNKNVWKIVLNINISWLLFGLSLGIMNSISQPVSKYYSWGENSSLIGLSNSLYPIGALIGALSSGSLMNSFGRKKSCAIINYFFITSSLLVLLFPFTSTFIASRFLAGVAGGMVISVCPKFANEFTPPEINSQVGPWMAIFSSFGFILAYFYGVLIELFGDDWTLWASSMFLVIILSAYQLCWIFFLMDFDSPVWYFEKGDVESCLESLELIYCKSSAKMIFQQFSKNDGTLEEPLLTQRKVKFFDVFCMKKFRKMMRIGLALASYQQLSGINVVLVYSNQIFEGLGSSGITVRLMTLALGFMLIFSNAFTVVALKTFGRKTILTSGAFLMAADLIGLAVVSRFSSISESFKLALVLAYLFFFSFSFGTTLWIYCAEVLNQQVMSLAVGMNFLMQSFVCFGFDFAIISGVHMSWIFTSFAVFMAFAAVHCFFELVETKERTKGEIVRIIIKDD